MENQNHNRQRILVVGGGIAGASLAYFLSNDSRYEITIIEKGPSWRTIGYAVGIWKVGIDVLKKLPLGEAFWAKTHPVNKGGFLDKRGKVLTTLNFSKLSTDGLGAITVERDVLHSAITKLLSPHILVRFSTTIKDIKNTVSGTHVSFNDASAESYDLVVIADGIRSMTRNIIFSNTLRSYGWEIWGDWSKKEYTHFNGNYLLRDAGQFLLSIPGQNQCAIGLFRTCDKHGLIRPPQNQREILESFSNLFPVLTKIISDINKPEKMFTDELVYVKMRKWYKKRVVLIGDAQHGMSPVSGWGTSLALEDAYSLAQILHGHNEIDAALPVFAKSRQKVLRKVRRYCRAIEFATLAKTKTGALLINTLLLLTPNLPQRLMRHATHRDQDILF